MKGDPGTLDATGADPTELPWILASARERPGCAPAGRGDGDPPRAPGEDAVSAPTNAAPIASRCVQRRSARPGPAFQRTIRRAADCPTGRERAGHRASSSARCRDPRALSCGRLRRSRRRRRHGRRAAATIVLRCPECLTARVLEHLHRPPDRRCGRSHYADPGAAAAQILRVREPGSATWERDGVVMTRRPCAAASPRSHASGPPRRRQVVAGAQRRRRAGSCCRRAARSGPSKTRHPCGPRVAPPVASRSLERHRCHGDATREHVIQSGPASAAHAHHAIPGTSPNAREAHNGLR